MAFADYQASSFGGYCQWISLIYIWICGVWLLVLQKDDSTFSTFKSTVIKHPPVRSFIKVYGCFCFWDMVLRYSGNAVKAISINAREHMQTRVCHRLIVECIWTQVEALTTTPRYLNVFSLANELHCLESNLHTLVVTMSDKPPPSFLPDIATTNICKLHLPVLLYTTKNHTFGYLVTMSPGQKHP